MGRPFQMQKDEQLRKLMPLLAAAGSAMPDDELREELRSLSVRALHTLHYRMERMLAESYEQGQRDA